MYTKSQALAVLGAALACVLAIVYSDIFLKVTNLFPKPPVRLTTDEETILLNSLRSISKPDGSQTVAQGGKRLKLAFCCSADLDVAIRAEELILKLNQTVRQAQHHSHIHGYHELVESFIHYFSMGAAAEQSMLSLPKFRQLVKLAEEQPSVRRSAGGNAATMAQRAAIEGNKVLLGAAIGKKMRELFHESIHFAGHLEDDVHEDIHLVLEYNEGDEIHGFSSPRANRYYLNHDIHNARISALEEFEASVDELKPSMIVIGGIQLMEVDIDESRRMERVRALSSFLQNMLRENIPSHFEFAAASDFQLYDDTVQLVLPWVKSIGLNEQELHILHHYLISGERTITAPSKPTVAQVNAKLADIIAHIESSKNKPSESPLSNLERIHFHTLQFHILCQKRDSPWGTPTVALVHGALMCSKIACGDKPKDDSTRTDFRSDEIDVSAHRVHVLLPRKFVLNENTQEEVEIDPHSPIISWDEGAFHCELTPTVACKVPDHTAGLGDNISGIGLAYHTRE